MLVEAHFFGMHINFKSRDDVIDDQKVCYKDPNAFEAITLVPGTEVNQMTRIRHVGCRDASPRTFNITTQIFLETIRHRIMLTLAILEKVLYHLLQHGVKEEKVDSCLIRS